MRILYILGFISFVFISCADKKENVQTTIAEDNVYLNVVDFRYEPVKQKAIILDGILGDSIPLHIMFDTGALSDSITISDSLKRYFSEEYVPLRIGSFIDTLHIKYYPEDHFFFQHFGSNSALLGWRFLKDKIIRISYKDKQIQEIEDISVLADQYTKIKIEKSDRNGLFIPVAVYVQGKEIVKNLLIDTGYNGAIDFGKSIGQQYSIDTDNARHVTSQGLQGSNNKYFIMSDSIKIKDIVVPVNKNIGFWIEKENPGLLGNEVLDQFDIILDFKDFNLYIKPLL